MVNYSKLFAFDASPCLCRGLEWPYCLHTSDRRASIFLQLCKPIRDAQGEAVIEGKGAEGSLKWNIEQACGAGFVVVTKLVNMLSLDGLAKLSFNVDPSEVGAATADSTQLELALLEEKRWLHSVLSLLFALIGRRAMALQSVLMAFPSHAAKLLSDNPVVRCEALAYWRAFGQDWNDICECKLPAVVALTRRSFANTAAFHDFQEQLSSRSYEGLTASLEHSLRTGFSLTTIIIEHFIKPVRSVEGRCQGNKQISRMRQWIVPIQRGVQNTLKHKSVDFKRVILKGSMLKTRLPKRWFAPAKKSTSMDFYLFHLPGAVAEGAVRRLLLVEVLQGLGRFRRLVQLCWRGVALEGRGLWWWWWFGDGSYAGGPRSSPCPNLRVASFGLGRGN